MDKKTLIFAKEQEIQQFDQLSETAIDQLLADEFIEFGVSGRVYTKAFILAQKGALQPPKIQMLDFDIKELAPNIILATYQANRLEANNEISQSSRRSSLWRQEGQTWRLVFHQGTLTPVDIF